MKERLKNLSNKKIVIISLCAFTLVLVLGFTYAYWTRTFSQTGENISTYDCFDVTFNESVEGISMENGYPISDEEGLKTDAYEVTITNNCKTVSSYNVVLNKLNTSTLDDSHVKIAVNSDIKLLSETESTTSTIENTSEAKIIYFGVLKEGKERTIKVQNWMDENTSEAEGTNKSLSYKITIEAVAGVDSNKYLATNILKEDLQTKKLTKDSFKKGEPVVATYKEQVETDKTYSTSIYSNISGNKALGTGYTFDIKTGKYTLTGIQTNQSFNTNSVGKYTCNASVGKNCSSLYKIKAVNESTESDNYTQTIEENQSVNLVSSNNKRVGSTISFDSTKGIFEIGGLVEGNVSYDESYIGYYTCNSTSITCSTAYKIAGVDTTNQTTVNAVNKYTKVENRNYVSVADYHIGDLDTETTDNGIYEADDDEGKSYYFRGNVKNNYVKFANIIWRIVRINGDGSIRLVMDNILDEKVKFSLTYEAKYNGYTYNHENSCTKNNPCLSDYNESLHEFQNNMNAVNSTIKNYLEQWYIDNLSSYNDSIALASYCNDTTIYKTSYGGIQNGAYGRIYDSDSKAQNLLPTLKCPDTDKTYGGSYKLKIGLLSADEMNMAGIGKINQFKVTSNYLYTDKSLWTMSPLSSGNIYMATLGTLSGSASQSYETYVKPVINLKLDTVISKGNGTKENPYVIE